MKSILEVGLLALLIGAGACSGRYEVGGEGQGGSEPAGSGTSGEASASGGNGGIAGSGSSTSGPSVGGFAGSSAPSAGAPPVDSACEPEDPPPPLTGELVEPAVVWQRVTRLIEGELASPPSKLPTRTTYSWVGDVVTQAFERARSQDSRAGTEVFVNYWLFRTTTAAEPPLEVDWGAALLEREPALRQLMLQPVGEHGYGIFSDRAWLVHASTISKRGARIYDRLVDEGPPLPPEPVSPAQPVEPLDMHTRREQLAVAVSEVVCQACHVAFDGLGYPYGEFDELGEFLELDNGWPIDTSGSVRADEEQWSYADTRELGEVVATSCRARQRFVVTLAYTALGLEGVSAEDQRSLVAPHRQRLERAFSFSETRSYEDAVRAYAQSPLVLQR